MYYGAYGSAAHMAMHDSAAAKSKASQAAERVRVLEANLAKVLMINEAMWEILRDKLNLTDEELNQKLYEIDMRDGVLDGKNQRSVTVCPSCQRKVSPRHPACIYCGQIIQDSVFHIR
jgi:hypothetical protein